MLYTPLTKKALCLSFEAHKKQVDKSGMPYVYHPYELATQMETEAETCLALLHDVVEDTSMTFDDLAAEGFGEEILAALRCLTHAEGVPYMDYVRKIKENPLATKVKLADLRHNSAPGRLDSPTDKDRERIAKYHRAMALLTGEED